MGKIGLISGEGKLPRLWAETASKRGYQIFAFSLGEPYSLDQFVDRSFSLNIGELGKLIQTLHQEQIEQIIFLGKVDKRKLFSGLNPDQEMQKLLSSLKNLGDDSILKAVAEKFENEGIKVLPQSTLLEPLLVESGTLTSNTPEQKVKEDMEYGLDMAREIGRLEIGQTVIVKNKSVIAVEAVEGTDAAIKRGGTLAREGIVMAKVSRPDQDFRFDIPTVGMNTLKNLKKVKAGGLALEAGKTFIIDKKRFIKEAEKAGIPITAMEVEGKLNE